MASTTTTKEGSRKRYPSDITREQFEEVRGDLEGARKRTRPREVDLYEVFCAVLYVLRSGCQWRMLPEGFPKWRTAYAYWRIWSQEREGGSLIERITKKTGRKGPAQTWAQGEPQPAHSRLAERQEH
jgi:transposase